MIRKYWNRKDCKIDYHVNFLMSFNFGSVRAYTNCQ